MTSFGINLGVGTGVTALIPASPIIAGAVGVAAAIATNKIAEHVGNEFLNKLLGSFTDGWIPRLYLDTIKKKIND